MSLFICQTQQKFLVLTFVDFFLASDRFSRTKFWKHFPLVSLRPQFLVKSPWYLTDPSLLFSLACIDCSAPEVWASPMAAIWDCLSFSTALASASIFSYNGILVSCVSIAYNFLLHHRPDFPALVFYLLQKTLFLSCIPALIITNSQVCRFNLFFSLVHSLFPSSLPHSPTLKIQSS